MSLTGAQLLVKTLEQLSVRYVFGIPGAKIDAVFDALTDSAIKLIVCRHEQNAAFMAGAYGRLTGEPGVVLVTSGPGVGNLLTGLLTATTEGDPIVAIGGNTSRLMLHKESHQSASNLKLMEGATKYTQEVYVADDISEAVVNAYRTAKAPKQGATFLSLPMDVSHEQTNASVISVPDVEHSTLALPKTLEQAASLINNAKAPVLFLGNEASKPINSSAINQLLQAHPMPVVMTFQACGALREENANCFFGRLGLFKNQPGDKLLDIADVIVAVGYNPVEYDPEEWNTNGSDKKFIHINYTMADIHEKYQPSVEVLGGIAENISSIIPLLGSLPPMDQYFSLKEEYENFVHNPNSEIDTKGKIHPLRFIYKLHEHVTKDTIIACDIGSNGTWMSRYFRSYTPHQMLISNGQQTLGVSIPWAIAAKLIHPEKTVIATVGDGAFLFSANELETAVREKIHFIAFVLDSASYDMVEAQELIKYQRKSGVDLGEYDVVKYAEAFGAKGYFLDDSSKFARIMEQSLNQTVPVLIQVPVDYTDNIKLYQEIDPHKGH